MTDSGKGSFFLNLIIFCSIQPDSSFTDPPDFRLHLMTLKRHIAAFSLLTSVLLGGLIAPLSHFAYMALGDAYQMESAHGQHESMPGEHQSANTPKHVSLAESGMDHLECPFAAFFLSQAPGYEGSNIQLDIPTTCAEVLLVPDTLVQSSDTNTSLARGPPSSSQHIA